MPQSNPPPMKKRIIANKNNSNIYSSSSSTTASKTLSTSLSSNNNTKSSMQKIYESMHKYIKTKNSKFIIDLEADTIAKSMNILWSIKKGMKN